MRSLGMILLFGFGLGILQGCAMPSMQSSSSAAMDRSNATGERMRSGTAERGQVPVRDEMVRRYLGRQMQPGTTLRFR